MSQVTASLVKELREKTGVGMMDCKTALKENNGDIEASIDWLRTKGIAKAAKKEGRIASEGLIAVEKIDNIASIIEVNSEILDKRIAKETPLVKLTLLSILRRLELMNKLRMPSDFNS